MVTEVSVRTNDERPTEEHRLHDDPAVSTIEAYEADGRTVFYDAENPLAWMDATRTLTLEELA